MKMIIQTKIQKNNDHEKIIDSTVDDLRWTSGENGLTEDVLDRLKASW